MGVDTLFRELLEGRDLIILDWILNSVYSVLNMWVVLLELDSSFRVKKNVRKDLEKFPKEAIVKFTNLFFKNTEIILK